jgi:hypothetical protein
MNLAQKRAMALEAARDWAHRCGMVPETVAASTALGALHIVTKADPSSVVAEWYRTASGRQCWLFCREWKKWCREQLAEKRKVAHEALRSQLRRSGLAPERVSAEDALIVLDDLAYAELDLIASRWYVSASQEQLALFCDEWERWCGERRRN